MDDNIHRKRSTKKTEKKRDNTPKNKENHGTLIMIKFPLYRYKLTDGEMD